MVGSVVNPSDAALSSVPLAPWLKPLVLIIDPDESTRSVLEMAMARAGFDVWTSTSGAMGLTLLEGRLPHVIVVQADLGGEEGFSFVAQLRGDERLEKIPVVLLAASEGQPMDTVAEVVGVDDLLRKPAYARDVVALVRLELAKSEGGALLFDPQVLPPAQLLRALLTSPQSGRLILANGRAQLRFRSGRVIDIRFSHSETELDMVIRALALTLTPYELVLEEVHGFTELKCGLRELIEQVMPRLHQWERVSQRSVPLDSRLTVDFGRLSQSLKMLPDEVNVIVQLFDGFRTVEQALVDSPFQESLTLEVTTRLSQLGILKPARGADDELVELRPMPKLFEPRPTEAEEMMQQLFASAGASPTAEADEQNWYSPRSFEDNSPTGGWTTAPIPLRLVQELSPELTKQLDAFQTPMRVESGDISPEVMAARGFARETPSSPEHTAMESALLGALEGQKIDDIEAELNAVLAKQDERAELDRDPQARIQTPSMTPAIQIHWPPSRAVDPVMATQSLDSTSAEDEFFKANISNDEDDTLIPTSSKKSRRSLPFVLGALGLVSLTLLIDAMRNAPLPIPVASAVTVQPVTVTMPVVEVEKAPEPLAVVEEPAVAPDVSENLAEANKLYSAGAYQRAISVLEQVLVDDPNSVAGWNLLALAKYDSLNSAGARAAAKKVLELDPRNARVQILLATLHFDAREKEQGRAALSKYLELEPNGPHVEEARALLKRY